MGHAPDTAREKGVALAAVQVFHRRHGDVVGADHRVTRPAGAGPEVRSVPPKR